MNELRIQALEHAANLVARGWSRRAYARDATGKRVLASHPSASQFSIEGAIKAGVRAVAKSTTYPLPPASLEAARSSVRTALDGADLGRWNDARERKRDEVVAALRRAAK